MKVPKAVEYIAVFLFLLFASVSAKHAGAKEQGDVTSTEGIPEYHPVDYLLPCLQKDGNFTKFLGFLKETDLKTFLYNFTTLTILAPTDDAFDLLPPAVLTRLETDTAFRTHVLLGHFVDQKLYLVTFIVQKTLVTLTGNVDKIHNSLAYDGRVFVDEANIIEGDQCDNGDDGLVQKIDRVIYHGNQTIMERLDSMFPELAYYMRLVGYDGLLNSSDYQFTLFAPTDEAILAISSELECLRYHDVYLQGTVLYLLTTEPLSLRNLATFPFIEGKTGIIHVEVDKKSKEPVVKVQDATIIEADIYATNGVIHKIDSFIRPTIRNLEGPCKSPSKLGVV